MSSILDMLTSKEKIPLYEKDELSSYEEPWQGKEFLTNIVKQYLLTFAISPFQVSETYLQVQYQKSKYYSSLKTFIEMSPVEENEGKINTTNVWANTEVKKENEESKSPESKESEENQIEKLERLDSGVIQPIHQIIESESEGWTGLLKGSFTSFIFNALYSSAQPFLEELLNDILDVYEDVDPRTNILSHIVVGIALSPLELVRTRLIVQASSAPIKKYRGTYHCMQTIMNEEGGMRGLYAPRYVIPSFLIYTLTPTLRMLSTQLISNYLLLTPSYNPILYPLVNSVLLAFEVAIITPLDLARKRIQCQIKKPTNRQQQLIKINSGNSPINYETAIEISSVPYTSILNVFKRVLLEEGNDESKNKKNNQQQQNQKNQMSAANAISQLWQGTKSLYRGFWQMYIRRFIQVAETMNDEPDDW